MSRTDKTQPFAVRLWDGTLTRVAFHDHRNGICDLPASYREERERTGETSRRGVHGCVWIFHYTGMNVCPCEMCHGGDWLRRARRADRHRARRDAAGLLKSARRDWRSLE